MGVDGSIDPWCDPWYSVFQNTEGRPTGLPGVDGSSTHGATLPVVWSILVSEDPFFMVGTLGHVPMVYPLLF